MKNSLLVLVLAASAALVGCERNSIKARSFSQRSKTLVEKLQVLNANVIANCVEADSKLNDIELAVYARKDVNGVDAVGVLGTAKILNLTNASVLGSYEVDETFKQDEVSISETDLSIEKKPESADQPSTFVLKLSETEQDVRIQINKGEHEITSDDVVCTRVKALKAPVENPSNPSDVPSEEPSVESPQSVPVVGAGSPQ
jgi:hypothetical protein